MNNQWTAAQGADGLGPYDDMDANSEEIWMRFLMPVLPAYAAFVMHNQHFTPHQLWTNLIPQLEADNQMGACSPLVLWA